MHRFQQIAVAGLILTAAAWAGESAAAAPVRALVAPALPAARQQMKHDQTEVSRLQREIARQESASQRASQRLQQQDQQIAALHRELARLRNSPPARHP
jgi:septal ring factor EnvC (AmiA/AmiB activator)